MPVPVQSGQCNSNESRKEQEVSPDVIINRLDNEIRAQFDLINERMSWLMVAQSFLFIAYANVWVGLSRGVHPMLSKLSVIIPSIGIAMAILVRLAIWAAHRVVSQVKDERARFENDHPAYAGYKISVHRKQFEHKLGNLPAQILPFVFITAWSGLLYLTAFGPR
jgi:hypothetical protein